MNQKSASILVLLNCQLKLNHKLHSEIQLTLQISWQRIKSSIFLSSCYTKTSWKSTTINNLSFKNWLISLFKQSHLCILKIATIWKKRSTFDIQIYKRQLILSSIKNIIKSEIDTTKHYNLSSKSKIMRNESLNEKWQFILLSKRELM